jgi:hypothetical protein
MPRPSYPGAEDITILTEDVLVATSDDRLRLWENPRFGPKHTADGALVALTGVDTDAPTVRGGEARSGIGLSP